MKTVDVDCIVLKATRSAYLLKTERDEEVWIPKSLCSGVNTALIPENEFDVEEAQTVAVAEWKAIEEGLA